VIFVIHPVFHVMTAALPSPPSESLASATPSPDRVVSKGYPAVSFTFHTTSKAAAKLAMLVNSM